MKVEPTDKLVVGAGLWGGQVNRLMAEFNGRCEYAGPVGEARAFFRHLRVMDTYLKPSDWAGIDVDALWDDPRLMCELLYLDTPYSGAWRMSRFTFWLIYGVGGVCKPRYIERYIKEPIHRRFYLNHPNTPFYTWELICERERHTSRCSKNPLVRTRFDIPKYGQLFCPELLALHDGKRESWHFWHTLNYLPQYAYYMCVPEVEAAGLQLADAQLVLDILSNPQLMSFMKESRIHIPKSWWTKELFSVADKLHYTGHPKLMELVNVGLSEWLLDPEIVAFYRRIGYSYHEIMSTLKLTS